MIDNLKLKNYENSLFIIKPDAYPYREQILEALLSKFRLVELDDVVLTERFLSELYQNEKTIFRNMNIQYMKDKKATIGIVGGESCKKRLFEFCGEDFRPELCKPDTIRRKFNICPNPINLDGNPFYINAIHRASPEDAEKEIQLYKREYVYTKQKQLENEGIKINGRE